MQAEVRWIEPNDIPIKDWPTWRPDGAEDELQWFAVGIGPPGDPGAEIFQVAVATPVGIKHSRRTGGSGALVVTRFEPEVVECAIREFVAACQGLTWDGVVDLLRTRMSWEYEGWR